LCAVPDGSTTIAKDRKQIAVILDRFILVRLSVFGYDMLLKEALYKSGFVDVGRVV